MTTEMVMMIACETSAPLIPARMLTPLVENVADGTCNVVQWAQESPKLIEGRTLSINCNGPRLIGEPNSGRSGLGTNTFVFPHSEKYTINSGIEAMTRTGNLCLHRISRRSSRNPRWVSIVNEMMEERYTESYEPGSGAVEMGDSRWGNEPGDEGIHRKRGRCTEFC